MNRIPLAIAMTLWCVLVALAAASLGGCSAFHPFGLGATPLPATSPHGAGAPAAGPGDQILVWTMWVGAGMAIAGIVMLVFSKGLAGKKLAAAGGATFLAAVFLHEYLPLILRLSVAAAMAFGAMDLYAHRERIRAWLRLGPRAGNAGAAAAGAAGAVPA